MQPSEITLVKDELTYLFRYTRCGPPHCPPLTCEKESQDLGLGLRQRSAYD